MITQQYPLVKTEVELQLCLSKGVVGWDTIIE